MLASLARLTGDLGLAEDALMDALASALERWPVEGTPATPGAWITTTARRKAIDRLRRRASHKKYAPALSALIELEGVHAHYGEHEVLDGVCLRLEPGEHLCIAGPNGCGKSTLLALICGDNPRAYGQHVKLFGRLRGSGESVWEIKRRFGIVSNQLHLSYPARTRAFDVVASGFFDTLGLYDTCGPRQAQLAREWLAVLGLSARAGERFDALSFGEQRMMLVARAMVKSPPILILDEPCSGLDEANRRRVLELIERIGHETHTQILYVSHEAEEMPACITRRLEFRRDAAGRYRLENAD